MSFSRKKISALVAAVILAVSMTSCASPDETSGSQLSGTLTVFAAASLKQAFTDVATEFEAAHPRVKISLSFDGSSTLATQIAQGAPVDVFASADTKNMTKLSDAELTSGTPVDFASNVLTLAVPASNPANITTFSDAAKPGVKLVICAAQVPCGAAAQADAESAGLTLTPVSEELSVTSVLGKVTSGEADAGLVYLTDALSAGDRVQTIALGLARPAVNKYPIAAVKGSQRPELAAAFIAWVTGAEGRKVLQDAGFAAP